MSESKTIAIFTGYYLPHLGGVERYVDKLSEALCALGYRIIIVTSNHQDLPAHENRGDITIYRLPIKSIFRERYPIPHKNEEYKKLIDDISKEGVDYLMLNTRFHLTSLIGARLAKKLNKPALLIEHGTGHFTVGNKLLDFFGGMYEHALTTKIKKHVDGFYGVSKNCNKWLAHFNIEAKGVFYNAINKNDSKDVKDVYDKTFEKNEVIVTYAGRILKEKGVVNLLDSFTKIKSEYPAARLVIAGDGPLLQELQVIYKDPRIHFVGRLDFEHVMSLYKRTDIFVYPSLYPEGLPTSVLEAGLMGCAVIATARGGTEEVIVDDSHGIIIDGNVDSIKTALETLIQDSEYRKKASSAIKYRVENVFDWDVTAETVNKELRKYGEG